MAGVVAVHLAWMLAYHLAGRQAAIIAGLLLALMPTHLVWSTQVLKDSGVVALALAGLLVRLELARATPARLAGRVLVLRVFPGSSGTSEGRVMEETRIWCCVAAFY